MTPPPLFLRNPSVRRLLRAAAILLAVVLLHLLAGAWGSRLIGRPAGRASEDVLTVSLQTEPPAPPKPITRGIPKPARQPATEPPPKARPKAPVPQPPPAPLPEPPLPASPPVIASEQGSWQVADAEHDGSGSSDAAATGAAQSSLPAGETAARPSEPAHAADAPPSVVLKYDVQGLRDGQKVYGSGKIAWRNQDGRYRIDGSASVLFFTLLQFSSDGVLDGFGVSPTLYTEKKFRKTATDTRFEHERNTITFSASDNSYPRPGDAQDRASIIWQLAAIGRGNPAAFFTGADFTMFVAGVRDAEPWRIIVSGEDEIEAEGDTVSAWHLVRMPQPGSYDQKIDIWLAPRQEWYPLKIRYTENDGDYLEMSLSSRTPP
ncbi:MAG TPA: DUF3108 domain-containing protein [Herbaspirillum sp.]|jgi:hypothetical protein